MPIEDFYETRYLKIAMTMKNIDQAAEYMAACTRKDPRYPGLDKLILQFAKTAKRKCETLRTDKNIYDVWSDFVVAGEDVIEFEPIPADAHLDHPLMDVLDVRQMLKTGVRLIGFITRARTPMPLSTENFLNDCERYKSRLS